MASSSHQVTPENRIEECATISFKIEMEFVGCFDSIAGIAGIDI